MNDLKMELILMRIENDKKEREERAKNVIDIEKIRQEKLAYQKAHPEEEIKPDCLITGWMVYLFVMIAGMIFVDYAFLAIAATFYFFYWRHDRIERANGRRY